MELPDREPPPDLGKLEPVKVDEKPVRINHFVGAPVNCLPRRQTAFRCEGFSTTIGEPKKNPQKAYLSSKAIIEHKDLDLNHTLQLQELTKYYADKMSFLENVVVPFGKDLEPVGMRGISLRLINWTVTILAQMRSIVYYVDADGELHDNDPGGLCRRVDIGNSYLQTIAPPLCKVDFDPCRRHARIKFPVTFQAEPIITTLGQLNFFRWANRICLLKWMQPRTAELEQHMALYKKMQAKRKRGEIEGDCFSFYE